MLVSEMSEMREYWSHKGVPAINRSTPAKGDYNVVRTLVAIEMRRKVCEQEGIRHSTK